MDFVQKDNTNMTNLQRVNEVGGAEDALDKVKNLIFLKKGIP